MSDPLTPSTEGDRTCAHCGYINLADNCPGCGEPYWSEPAAPAEGPDARGDVEEAVYRALLYVNQTPPRPMTPHALIRALDDDGYQIVPRDKKWPAAPTEGLERICKCGPVCAACGGLRRETAPAECHKGCDMCRTLNEMDADDAPAECPGCTEQPHIPPCPFAREYNR